MSANEVLQKFMTKLDDEKFIDDFVKNPNQALTNIDADMSLDELFSYISTDEKFYQDIVSKMSLSVEESTLKAVTSSCD
ncbi:hypothetical protein [Clostridium beijerinckii]|uniref:hypothetical protein n=1 Tax=Clostridium beijerinckii TaxID=1520 RepID=UPI00098C6EB3|nr:hypothetical protein [Clostridium beijerinckii]MBA8932410.1 hypothetical protein [Clostridium beijerinckii]NRT37619.1 hypothetical protein [Clostridium beijerinckii]NRT48638.1 hypothetical protein [Clostridium beijerinckii]NRU36615.1 hypothetical protein [Clostridium beijerinckii]NRZ23066.1 hypothetical protein [Clostridium beijerinckii]